MEYSNKLVLKEFFDAFEGLQYSIIKLDDDFPNYYNYSDVDIFCYSIEEIAKRVFSIGNKYLEKGFEIRVNEIESGNQIHIDFIYNGKLDFKFDLYQSLPKYNHVLIKEGYFSSIIENSIINEKTINSDTFYYKTPQKIDDLIIRYIEYVEYFDIRADKIKHVEHINSQLGENERNLFFDKLHYYTKLPDASCNMEEIRKDYSSSSIFLHEVKSRFKSFIKFRFILKPIEQTLRKIKKKKS